MCSCSKKINTRSLVPDAELGGAPELTVEMWGPLMWKHLHVMSDRIGTVGDYNTAARHFSRLVHDLPDMLPCYVCRTHAKQYLLDNTFSCNYRASAEELRAYCREYFFKFHQAVRVRKEQPILIATIDDYKTYYASVDLTVEDTNKLRGYLEYSRRKYLIKSPNNWFRYVNDVKILCGLPVY